MKNIEDMDTMEQEILPVVLIWEKREAEMVKEAKHIQDTCNKSGYWINGNHRKCVGKWTRHSRTFRDDHSATCR